MNSTTLARVQLSEQQCRQFEHDGYLAPIPVLNDQEVERLLDSYMEYSTANKARLDALPPNQKYKVLSETHFVFPWAYEIVTNTRVLDAVEGLLGPNLIAWNSNWFTKMPGEKSYVGWHQDGTYWKLNPPTVVTAWVALTPSTTSNGCMRVIPGTHTQPMIPQRETYRPENALSRGQEIAVVVDETQAVDLKLQPGEMSLHHIWIIHGSNANTSKGAPRIGVAIRYTRPDVVQESPTKPFAMLVRGVDTCGNFDLQPPPKFIDSQQLQTLHQTIVEHARGSLMTGAKRQQ
jgi:non-heme Fe2+,alpha-ketoglutarate-dependent halogenase